MSPNALDMRPHWTTSLFAAVIVTVGLLVGEATFVAPDSTVLSGIASAEGRRSSLTEGASVRRKLLYRSSRFELMPTLGFTINDSYKRNLLVGAEANYHLTNEFGIGVSGSYGVTSLNTDLLDQIEGTVDESITNQLTYGVTTVLVDAHVSYVPLFGKFGLFRVIVDYDIHLLGGFGGALIGVDGEGPGTDLEGFKPGPVVGGGARFFFADSIGLTVDLKDYIYSTADVQDGEVEPTSELRDNFVFHIGVSFFFPGEVAISR